jgi:hypothetical protein
MKTIALEQAETRISEALKQQGQDEPIRLKTGSEATGLLLRVPEGMKDSDFDLVGWQEGPEGRFLVLFEAKLSVEHRSHSEPAHPVFGSCQGMLTIVSEDEDHLKDFEEYMK